LHHGVRFDGLICSRMRAVNSSSTIRPAELTSRPFCLTRSFRS
jgi:hypothetical protein